MVGREITTIKTVAKNGTSLSLNLTREFRRIGVQEGDKVCVSIIPVPSITQRETE